MTDALGNLKLTTPPEGEKRGYDPYMANIQTSLVVIAESAKTNSKNIASLTQNLKEHTVKEETLYAKMFDKMDETKDACDKKHEKINIEIASAKGAAAGGKWVLGAIGVLASIALFLGLKAH